MRIFGFTESIQKNAGLQFLMLQLTHQLLPAP